MAWCAWGPFFEVLAHIRQKQTKYQSDEPSAFLSQWKKVKLLDVRSFDWKFWKNTRNLSQSCHRARPYGLGRLNCVNTKLMSFQHLRSMIAKGVPRMVIGSPGLQNWTCNHVLTISYVWMHHVGSLKRAKVLLTSKVGVVTHIWLLDNMKFVSKMIKITPKWWKFVHRSHVWDTYTV